MLNFNPRFPRGKRPSHAAALFCLMLFQSTLPAREATIKAIKLQITIAFQSTLPAREATRPSDKFRLAYGNFNPRFPRGKRPTSLYPISISPISIHASRGGSDEIRKQGFGFRTISIHASRGGSDQGRRGAYLPFLGISIHASRGGSDSLPCYNVDRFYNFNPRFPRGKRLPRT